MAALALTLLLIGGWQLYTAVGTVDKIILPAPSDIAAALWNDRALLADNLAVTAGEMIVGLLIAMLAGALLATSLHLLPTARRAVYPLLIGSQAIPIVTIAPLLAAWFGFGLLPKVLIVALVCFFPVVVTTLDGLDRVDPESTKVLRSFGASRRQRLLMLELPAALPAALSGAKVAVAVGGIATVFAEYAGSEKGLGHLLMQSIPQLDTARAWAAVTVLAALAVACFGLLTVCERSLAPWAHQRKDPTR